MSCLMVRPFSWISSSPEDYGIRFGIARYSFLDERQRRHPGNDAPPPTRRHRGPGGPRAPLRGSLPLLRSLPGRRRLRLLRAHPRAVESRGLQPRPRAAVLGLLDVRGSPRVRALPGKRTLALSSALALVPCAPGGSERDPVHAARSPGRG